MASDASYIAGGLFREPVLPPSPSPAQDQPASDSLAGPPTPDGIEFTEQPSNCQAESVFPEDIEDEFVVEDGDDTKALTTELFEEDGEYMELQPFIYSGSS